MAPCLPRFVRSGNVPEPPLPPSSLPYGDHYGVFPARDRLSAPFQPAPPQPFGPVPPVPSGMYAPVYDSRRIWRPQLYPRDDLLRSNSFPPVDLVHPSVYQTFLRERLSSLDGSYSTACPLPAEPRTLPLPRVGAGLRTAPGEAGGKGGWGTASPGPSEPPPHVLLGGEAGGSQASLSRGAGLCFPAFALSGACPPSAPRQEPCGHLKPSCEDPLRRKPEQWGPCHAPKAPLLSSALPAAAPSPTPPSPLFSVDFGTEVNPTQASPAQWGESRFSRPPAGPSQCTAWAGRQAPLLPPESPPGPRRGGRIPWGRKAWLWGVGLGPLLLGLCSSPGPAGGCIRTSLCPPQFCESTPDLGGGAKYEDGRPSHYSPWSCGTLGSCIGTLEAEPADVLAGSGAVLAVRLPRSPSLPPSLPRGHGLGLACSRNPLSGLPLSPPGPGRRGREAASAPL